ncbi:hypothetical protein U1Q18_007318 [Sarracenia purpurea var. burkii]
MVVDEREGKGEVTGFGGRIPADVIHLPWLGRDFVGDFVQNFGRESQSNHKRERERERCSVAEKMGREMERGEGAWPLGRLGERSIEKIHGEASKVAGISESSPSDVS